MLPAFVVLSRSFPVPPAHPSVGLVKNIDLKVELIPLGCRFQFVPPFGVAYIIPDSPATQPEVSETKQQLFNPFLKPLFIFIQLSPPSLDL